MNARKTIQINPKFLKIGADRSKTKRKHNFNKDLRTTIKPNDIKKKLMSKIKDYQHKSKDDTTVDATEKFTKDFNDQLGYLEKIISAKKGKKKRRRTKKHQAMENSPSDTNDIITSTIPPPSIRINTLQDAAMQTSSPTQPTKPTLPPPVVPIPAAVELAQIPSGGPQSAAFANRYPEPRYGCLKGGRKPTYSEYRKTLKKRDHLIPKEKIIFTPLPQLTDDIQDRKTKLQLLKNKLAEPKSLPIKKFKKMHKTVKIYRLGKDKKARAVGVLIKSGKTRKLVKTEQEILRVRCLSEVREYLRKHNLIKAGTTAPEDILRKLYEDSFLAGNIFNKNPDNLLHNYLSEELDN